MITLKSPKQIRFHVQARTAWVNLECHKATVSPNTALKRPAIWGVIKISGRRIITVRSHANTFLEISIYISVFPLPVTPCNKCEENFFGFNINERSCNTSCCFFVK